MVQYRLIAHLNDPGNKLLRRSSNAQISVSSINYAGLTYDTNASATIFFKTNEQMTWDLKVQMDKLDDDELSTTERNQYILKSRLSLKFFRLTLGEDYAEFILQRKPHKTHSGTDTILEGSHSKFTNGGSLKIVAGNGKGENGNGGNIVMQGGSRFS